MTSAVVIGAGPGIGLAVARRFAREGFALALVGRNKETVTGVADSLEGVRALPLVADSSDEVALTAAAHTAPGMAERGHGTFVVTGGMPEPKPEYVSLSLGKAGVRALVDLLDRQYGPSGVHVATVTVSGPVAPGTAWDPDEIAEQYWRLHTQPRAEWEREIVV
ncbi:SDR family NAD(P)-dependent oxidoreductase [Streptomyces justiciae]|uniref:SDR family NAD(P)-dependent oxidoreductase n=1 Tax=Streptomyces justiciae TaxID=2780140 RepID=UPI001880D1BC|nr:SDR family NAD(P)-dependent oxidoreductase [Streptomyces justiciae]MBE8473778.1 SDR family NAD(P)-dependent oxidoreductase [Streptomyces justiciae]